MMMNVERQERRDGRRPLREPVEPPRVQPQQQDLQDVERGQHDEERGDHEPEAAAHRPALVDAEGPGPHLGEAAGGGGADRRDLAQQVRHRRSERLVGARLLEERQRTEPCALVEAAHRGRLDRFERVHERLVGAVAAPLEGPEGEIHRDEHDVDQREGRLEEVVHVAGDELAELVDEPSEAGTAQHGDEPAGARRDERDRRDEGGEHHRPAPDGVRDVQRAVPDLRIAGQHEEEPVAEHAPDRAREEQVEVARQLGAADREPVDPASLLGDLSAHFVANGHGVPHARIRSRLR